MVILIVAYVFFCFQVPSLLWLLPLVIGLIAEMKNDKENYDDIAEEDLRTFYSLD